MKKIYFFLIISIAVVSTTLIYLDPKTRFTEKANFRSSLLPLII